MDPHHDPIYQLLRMAKAKGKIKKGAAKPRRQPNKELAKKGVLTDRHSHKVADEVFWRVLENNGGLYTPTANALMQEFPGLSYTRGAVQIRAEKQPERLAAIREGLVDEAEKGLRMLVRTGGGEPGVMLNAIKYYLDRLGALRGYGAKPVEVTASAGEEGAETPAVSLTIKIAQ